MLHRGPAGWRWGASPMQGDAPSARADRDAANRLAAAADGLPISNYITDDPARHAELGLTDPAATLTLRPAAVSGAASAPPPACILRLGRPADRARPPSRYATASFGPNPSPVVFRVAGAAVAPLLADPAGLRDARLVVARASAVRGLRVNRVGAGVVELASDQTRVRFVEPDAQATADPRWGAAWIQLLHEARAQAFAPAPPEAQAPVAIATLHLAADRVERVRIYEDRHEAADTLLAVRENEPVAAVLPAAVLAPLLGPAITLHDTRLPAPAGIATIRLQRDDGVVYGFSQLYDGQTPRLQVDGVGLDPAARWDVHALRRLQTWLASPRAVQWTPRAELPRGPVARLSTGPDAPAYSVNVGQNLAQRTDLPGVFRVAPEIAALFDAEYRPRVLIDARGDEITAIDLQHPDAPTPRAPEPRTLRDRIAGLRAERWLPRGRSAPRPAHATWSLRVQAGPREWTLERVGTDRWRIDGTAVRLSTDDADALDRAVDAWISTPPAP